MILVIVFECFLSLIIEAVFVLCVTEKCFRYSIQEVIYWLYIFTIVYRKLYTGWTFTIVYSCYISPGMVLYPLM